MFEIWSMISKYVRFSNIIFNACNPLKTNAGCCIIFAYCSLNGPMTLPFPHEEHPDLGSTAQRLEQLILPKGVKATPVFHTYWFFAAERQRIFFERLHNRKY